MMLTANKNNLMRTQYIYYSVDNILEPTNVITLKSTEETESVRRGLQHRWHGYTNTNNEKKKYHRQQTNGILD